MMNAQTEIPRISHHSVNVFMKRKKRRPKNPPDSYVSMIYIINEKQFDFGPLLIGKNIEDKQVEETENICPLTLTNSNTFRITNNGKFQTNVKFYLSSEIKSEEEEFENEFKREIFFIDPTEMELAIMQTQEIRIWAIPQDVQVYRDELICVVENNPVPEVFAITCEG